MAVAAIDYVSQKHALLQQIDHRLLVAARLAEAAVPDDYHDRITGTNSVPSEEFLRIARRNNVLCHDLGLQSLWSCLAVSNELFFTTAGFFEPHHTASFFQPYRDDGVFELAQRTMQPDYRYFDNQWGSGRMVLAPGIDARGRHYFFGASVSSDSLDAQMGNLITRSLWIVALILFLGLSINVFVSRRLSRQLTRLAHTASNVVHCDMTPLAPGRGAPGAESVTRSFGLIKDSIRSTAAGFHQRLAERLWGNGATQQVDEKIQQLNQMLRSIRDTNQQLRQEKDKDAMLKKACDILIHTRGHLAVSIALLEPDSDHVTPAAQAAKTTEVQQDVGSVWPDLLTQGGPAGIAVQTRQPVIIDDISGSPLCTAWRDRLAKHGGASVAAIPLICKTSVFGVLTVITKRPGAFGRDEICLLSSLSVDVGCALQKLDAEAHYKETEETRLRLATAVEQAAESIVITDVAGTILYVNPAFEKITGYSRKEAVGQTPRILKSGKHPHTFYKQMWDTLHRGEIWRGHLTNRRKDGTLYEEQTIISPVRNANGEGINFVAVKRDVTRETQLESRLRQAEKMEAVGRLAGGIAHDFNNILIAILGHSDLALRHLKADDRVRENIEEVKQAGLRAAELTRQLLAFSRKQNVQPRVIDLNQHVTTLQKMLHRLISENIVLTIKLDPTLGRVNADPGQIEQIIMNLAVNARDAMPQGGRLTIETANVEWEDNGEHSEAAPGRYAMIAVTDTGVGMDAEVKAHLFEPFYTTKEPGRGTGLGLSTVYGIVKQSRGHINVFSEPGQGTRFRIYLPLVEGSEISSAFNSQSLTEVEGTKETILVVEDADPVRRLSRAILEVSGYKVLEAADGVEAFVMSESTPGRIDLLLTDLIMPQMGGRELAIQLLKRHPQMRILYMSGYTEEEIARQGILASGAGFVQKPFTPDTLLSKVREQLQVPRA